MSEKERAAAELLRQEAEVVREEHEELRQEAEGGPPEEIELGRVEAEDERVAAEGERAAAETVRIQAETVRVVAETDRDVLRKTYLKVATAIALPLAFIALIPAGIGLYLVTKEANARCQDSQLNRAAIRDTVLNSFSSLGYRYDEKTKKAVEIGGELAYYKEHLDERADALKRTLAAVERFPTIKC